MPVPASAFQTMTCAVPVACMLTSLWQAPPPPRSSAAAEDSNPPSDVASMMDVNRHSRRTAPTIDFTCVAIHDVTPSSSGFNRFLGLMKTTVLPEANAFLSKVDFDLTFVFSSIGSLCELSRAWAASDHPPSSPPVLCQRSVAAISQEGRGSSAIATSHASASPGMRAWRSRG